MAKIALLYGKSIEQTTKINEWKNILLQCGHEVFTVPFEEDDCTLKLQSLCNADYDQLIAYNLDILSINLTGGDFFINKFTSPLAIVLDSPIFDRISLFQKRINVTVLFYTTILDDQEKLTNLSQPVFCRHVTEQDSIENIFYLAQRDIYTDY